MAESGAHERPSDGYRHRRPGSACSLFLVRPGLRGAADLDAGAVELDQEWGPDAHQFRTCSHAMMLDAFRNSIQLSFGTALLGTVLATILAYAILTSPSRWSYRPSPRAC